VRLAKAARGFGLTTIAGPNGAKNDSPPCP
jgi:nicotinamide mononucleotide (NMN) deamidase PncC